MVEELLTTGQIYDPNSFTGSGGGSGGGSNPSTNVGSVIYKAPEVCDSNYNINAPATQYEVLGNWATGVKVVVPANCYSDSLRVSKGDLGDYDYKYILLFGVFGGKAGIGFGFYYYDGSDEWYIFPKPDNGSYYIVGFAFDYNGKPIGYKIWDLEFDGTNYTTNPVDGYPAIKLTIDNVDYEVIPNPYIMFVEPDSASIEVYTDKNTWLTDIIDGYYRLLMIDPRKLYGILNRYVFILEDYAYYTGGSINQLSQAIQFEWMYIRLKSVMVRLYMYKMIANMFKR